MYNNYKKFYMSEFKFNPIALAKKGGTLAGKGLEKVMLGMGALGTPLMLSQMIIPDATTRAQMKMQQDAMKQASPATYSQDNVRITNMNPNMVQPPDLQRNSMRY